MLIKNIRLLASAAVIAALTISAYTLHNATSPGDNNPMPAQRGEPPHSVKPLGNDTSTAAPNTRTHERLHPTTNNGPAIEYPDYVKTTDTSAYGQNAPVYQAYDDTLEALAEGGIFWP